MMNTRPRLLDLFSGAGGAAMGYHRAGFDVVGVDIAPYYGLTHTPTCDKMSVSHSEVRYAPNRRCGSRDGIGIKGLSRARMGSLLGLRKGTLGIAPQRSTAKRTLSSMWCAISDQNKALQLVESRRPPALEGWSPCGCEWVLFNCCSDRQSVSFYGRQEGARI